MRPLERQRAIASLVDRQGDLTVEEACRTLGISPATTRRDFLELTRRGLVEKTWGGVKRPATRPPAADMLPSSVRESLNAKEKERIARAACGLIQDGDVPRD